ncbi:Uncharacterised protein [Chryseobacterium taihuense]|uniref:Uncharacterized protein n=1 Tax=Chryseobacterium taihuense TaxID=1141221 RepID=A0A4V6IDV0_9FLAO|nr:Uncharacterised protein [Chryseobacterium taihuense]
MFWFRRKVFYTFLLLGAKAVNCFAKLEHQFHHINLLKFLCYKKLNIYIKKSLFQIVFNT